MSTGGYPAAPWRLRGQMWGTLFAVAGAPGRPRGAYAAAFVSYEPGSPLTYSELLVARPLGGTRVQVTDIWVDSPASRAGGRELWAIPKELCGLRPGHPAHRAALAHRVVRRVRPEAGAARSRGPLHRRVAGGVRLPLRGGTRQPPLVPGERTAGPRSRGSAKVLPGRATGSSRRTGRWPGCAGPGARVVPALRLPAVLRLTCRTVRRPGAPAPRPAPRRRKAGAAAGPGCRRAGVAVRARQLVRSARVGVRQVDGETRGRRRNARSTAASTDRQAAGSRVPAMRRCWSPRRSPRSTCCPWVSLGRSAPSSPTAVTYPDGT